MDILHVVVWVRLNRNPKIAFQFGEIFDTRVCSEIYYIYFVELQIELNSRNFNSHTELNPPT